MRRRRLGATPLFAVAFAVSLALALISARVDAEDFACATDTGRPIVAVVLEVEPPDQILADNLARHLRGELTPREMDVCTSWPASAKPIARVRLHVTRQGASVMATIEVRDEVTDKRLERTIELGKMPIETRALVVASAADELLRASWIELTLADAPPPAMAPPPALVRVLETEARVSPGASGAAERTWALGIDAQAFVLPKHDTSVGASLWSLARLGGPAFVGVSFGYDRGIAHEGIGGVVHSEDLHSGASIGYVTSTRSSRFGLRASAGVDAIWVRFVADASGHAVGTDASVLSAMARAALRAFVRLGRLDSFDRFEASLEASPFLVLRPVRADDALGQVLASREGLGVAFSLGFGGWL